MTNKITNLGVFIRKKTSRLGYAARFLCKMFALIGIIFRRPRLLSQQIYFLGNRSVSIIAIAGIFVGFALALQIYYVLSQFSSEQALGYSVGLSLLREMGPVVTALLFAGRAGTALTAEIGLMKAGEQLVALEMMAINPIQRILVPRFWAGLISLPLLTMIFNMVGILGAYAVGVGMIGIDEAAFWSKMQDGISILHDIGNSLIKSIVFGILVSFIALYQGYEARPTPEGVALATTNTVIVASLSVLGFNFLLTALMFS